MAEKLAGPSHSHHKGSALGWGEGKGALLPKACNIGCIGSKHLGLECGHL